MGTKEKRGIRLSEADRWKIFQKTSGHCHFCGDRLIFKNRGRGTGLGAWEADHIIQLARDEGKDTFENYLPACAACNQLRWFYNGNSIRELLILGLVGKKAIKDGTNLGKKLKEAIASREKNNIKRRKKTNI